MYGRGTGLDGALMTKAHKKAVEGYRKGIEKIPGISLELLTGKTKLINQGKIKFLKRMIRNCEKR